jgi:hypothetical protein
VSDDVVISVDPHKASNTAAVMDPATKIVIASRRFANTVDGYRELRRFSERWNSSETPNESTGSAFESAKSDRCRLAQIFRGTPGLIAADSFGFTQQTPPGRR